MLLALFKKIAPMFEKDGILQVLYPLYEGTFTLFFSSGKVTQGRTHVRDFIDLKRIMIIVCIAAIPTMLWGWYNVGEQTVMAIAAMPNAAEIADTRNRDHD